MFAIVPYIVALFAPLELAPAPRPAGPRPPTAAMLAHAAATTPLLPEPAASSLTAKIVVPDESRTQLLTSTATGGWLPAANAPAGKPAADPSMVDSFFATVRKHVRNTPDDPKAAATLLVASARQSEQLGHHNLAREDIALALERDPTNADALWVRAGHRYAAADYAGALRDADAVLLARPLDAAARFARAAVLMECGGPAEAHRELTALIRIAPEDADAYAARAEAALALGRWQDADLDSEIAVELAPGEPRHRLLRMKTCVACGRGDEVYGHFRAGYDTSATRLQTGPGRQVAVELLELFVAGWRYELTAGHAVESYDWMVKACPDYNRPRLMLAAELLASGQPDAAQRVAAEALERDPDCARAYHLRGSVRAALGRADALADFEAAFRREAAADTRAELLSRYHATGRRAEARVLAEDGVEASPDCRACRQFLAGDDLRRGDFAAAERHATCALWLARDPAAEASARLTRALARLAQSDPAAGDDFGALATLGEPEALATGDRDTSGR